MEDLTGKKFHKLTAIKWIPPSQREKKHQAWLCRCDCGNYRCVATDKLLHGTTKSCGCMKAERVGNLNKKYKCNDKHLYGVYQAMIYRCTNPKDPSYHNYGGRGIKVCQEWLDDFDNFAEWAVKSGYVFNAPQGQYTLDRKDNSKDYSPDNCRWVNMSVQQNNKRTCRYFEYDGETHSIADWARKWGYKYNYLYSHLMYKQEPIERFAR